MPLMLAFKLSMTEFANEVTICKARLLQILIPFSLSRSTTLLLRLQCRIVNAFAITNLFSLSDEILKSWWLSCFIWKSDFVGT